MDTQASALATATGKQVVASGGLASLTKDGHYVKSVSVALQSRIANSQVTATANILGIQ